jgi:hypothetical protein
MMNTQGILIAITLLISLFLIGCENDSSVSENVEIDTITSVSMNTPYPTSTFTNTPTETITITPSPTNTEIPSETPTPTIPPETRILVQCLEVLPEIPDGAISNGIVVLEGGSGGEIRSHDMQLLDMLSGKATTVSFPDETQLYHVVSLDRSLIAYLRFTSDKDGNRVKHLVIATADGQIQKEIPWGEKWAYLLSWASDQRLLLTYDDPELREKENWSAAFAFLILDPFSGKQELLHPIFPDHLAGWDIPYWDGWFGAIYDPTITRTIYPQMISDTDEFYTFGLWDVSTQEIVSSMESVFVDWVYSSIAAPKPVWAEDGSRLAFVGFDYLSDEAKFELYQASRDGQVTQLTNLTPIVHFRDLRFSWSPDSRKIAMLLDIQPEIDGENILVLNLETKEITDTCISVKGHSGAFWGYRLIWSPDGQQILVKDWLNDSNSRIILVDVKQGFAAQIAENTVLNGWMNSP